MKITRRINYKCFKIIWMKQSRFLILGQMSFCWEYSQEMILLMLAFLSTSCCKFCICFIFQPCHVKISNHSFSPGFFLQLRPHSAHIIVSQSAVRFVDSFPFPISKQLYRQQVAVVTTATSWVTAWTVVYTCLSREKETLVWLRTALTQKHTCSNCFPQFQYCLLILHACFLFIIIFVYFCCIQNTKSRIKFSMK